MKRILRRIARYLIKNNIRVFYAETVVEDEMLMRKNGFEIKNLIKEELAHKIAMKMLEEGFIDFEDKLDMSIYRRRFRGRVRVI